VANENGPASTTNDLRVKPITGQNYVADEAEVSEINGGYQSALSGSGTRGPKGDQGARGDTGPQGIQGIQGPAATITLGSVSTTPVGTPVAITNTGTSGAAVLNFALPGGVEGPRGIQGVKGDKGDTGAAATLALGSFSTGLPGTSVLISNSGTSGAAVLNFTIPRGDQGIQGIQGIQGLPGVDALLPNLTIGAVGNLTSGSQPTVSMSGTYPNLALNFGVVRGVDAPLPNISVGSVGNLPSGSQPTVTLSGTYPNLTLSFGVVRGVDAITPTISGISNSTLAPGSSATSSITPGPNNTYAISLGLPRGDQGIQGIQGIQGVIGNTGPQGLPATFSSVGINTLAPGSTATAQLNSGANNSYSLSLGIPRGDVGAQGIQGIKGDTGVKGDTGNAATIALGSVTTGLAGSSTQITNSGTPGAAILNFTIPRGDQGLKGDTGTAATVALGTVTTGAAGSQALITNTGDSAAAVLNFTIPQGLQGIQGIQGVKGDTGLQGVKGDTGTAATIALGSVSTGAAGSVVEIVNSGTSGAAVLDFTIPRGDTGLQGLKGDKGDLGNTGPQGLAASITAVNISTLNPGENATAQLVPGANNSYVINLAVPRGQQGAAGAGTGDMLNADNLAYLADFALARTNLGVEIGKDVQAYSIRSKRIQDSTATSVIYYDDGTGVFSPLTVGPNLSVSGGQLNAVASNNAQQLGGQTPAYYTNSSNQNAGTLPAARLPAFSGDLTSAVGSASLTLQSVNGSPGVFGSGTAIPVITVNAKGLVTNVTTTAITLGTAAARNIGTSGGTVPLLDGINTWADTQTFTKAISGSVTGNAATATKWATARAISWTGDATGSLNLDGSADASSALTLATVNTNPGTFGSGTSIPVVTVNAKGLVTSLSATSITLGTAAARDIGTSGHTVPLLDGINTWADTQTFTKAISGSVTGNAATATTAGQLTTARTISWTGDATGSLSFDGSANATSALTLASVNASPGVFGSSTAIPVLTVNAKGLVTSVSTVSLVLAPAVYQRFVLTGPSNKSLTLDVSGMTAVDVIVTVNGIRLDPTTDYSISGATLTIDASYEVDNGYVLIVEKAGGTTGAIGPKGDKGDIGNTGAQGIQGNTGTKGDAGTAATITLGTTTTSAPGTSAQVTNTGDATAAVFSFSIPRGDVGAQGIKGDKGNTGDAATITLGTVTTGAPGSMVVISNSGTSGAAVLNFTIPRGNTGDKGDQGIQGIQGVKGDKGDTGAPGAAGGDMYKADNLSGMASPEQSRNNIGAMPRKAAINTYTASGTVVLADQEALVRMNVASANTYTVPSNATLALAIGTFINVQQVGAGQTSFVPASGVTFQSDTGYVKLKGQYSGAQLIKVDTDVWALIGALVA
jgi:hypothetical protein